MLLSVMMTLSLVETNGQAYNTLDGLLDHLFSISRYNKFLRPLNNQSLEMKINFSQYINRIEYFDISSGVLAVTAHFRITWKDELLSWNPSLYGDRETIPLPKGKFWKPELALINGATNENSFIDSTGFSPAWVNYQGIVTMTPAGSYATRCNIDTTLYPFDKHGCTFEFVLSNHDNSEVMLFSETSNINTTHLELNGEWEIENTKSSVALVHDNVNKRAIPMALIAFTLKRRPLFEMINSYAPIFFMFILNVFTCFVPPNSGERLSFAVTLYLSLVFSTTSITERIPNNSLKLPLMSYDILILTFINTAGVTWSIFIVYLTNIKTIQRQLPAFIMKMIINKRKGCKSRMTPLETNNPTIDFDKDEEYFDKNKEDHGKDETTVTKITENAVTGPELADVLDKIYFWIVMLFLFIFNFVYITVTVILWKRN